MREMGSMLLPEIDYGLVPALLGENKTVKEPKMEKIRQNLFPLNRRGRAWRVVACHIVHKVLPFII